MEFEIELETDLATFLIRADALVAGVRTWPSTSGSLRCAVVSPSSPLPVHQPCVHRLKPPPHVGQFSPAVDIHGPLAMAAVVDLAQSKVLLRLLQHGPPAGA